VIPRLIAEGACVRAYDYVHSCVNMSKGFPYWRDVGTVDAFCEANLALVQVEPELNLYDEEWPIWTYQEQLPPAKFVFDDEGRRGTALDSIISSGCIVSGSTVRRSLLFSKVQVHSYCTIEDSVILPDVEVGRHVVLKRAVVDSHCRLPEGLVVGLNPAEDRRRFHLTDRGVTLIIPEMLGQQIHHLR
jgi:glucose-1-phosphate adenylyltransferase